MELLAPGNQELLELQIVFDDAVVNHGNFTAVRHMGMTVGVRWRAVGGPAGVPDTGAALQRPTAVGQVHQRLQPALGLGDLQVVTVEHTDAGGIIATVFQLAETFE